ncbi:amylo-alpha-1,6-glucosidase [Alsobacter metallidurans]|uniref:Amylo-alpha-1,6-glucosidase n=1 Tax=Alsobacter metallidurans TaxID=340221 RepID=A0A917IBR8_9HYPH|nr:amylo-alpha-1,6-glucosidase [Alsobacter metallidurans]GGH32238.1 amylo-alpha-1,6-glucosidase [Alsobacter metallidurans]
MLGITKPRPADGEPEKLSEHYIETDVSLVERTLRSLKHGDSFAVLDGYGDIGSTPGAPEGLFFRDTRYLSRFELRFEGKRPLLLSSVIQDDNAALSVDLTNQDVRAQDPDGIPRDLISLDRTKFLWREACYERIGLRNFADREVTFRLDLLFDADFRDLFEVRGVDRLRRGAVSSRVVSEDQVEFVYDGLDGARRRTLIAIEPAPERLDTHRATLVVTLPAGGRASVIVRVAFEEGGESRFSDFVTAFRDKRRENRRLTRRIATVETSNEHFNEVLCRSTSDLYMLTTQTPEGLYPYAGIPWYSTVFGRDGIITAMQMLWADPAVAHGVLGVLAATQATDYDAAKDAQPGKIMHERRQSEMARTGEVPFQRYYGTVDATPLFVMLAGLYHDRTGDSAFIRSIWPAIKAAVAWCDRDGDRDRDGFVEYFRETDHGLANQGWKDSHDSVFHADGSPALGPIALCEVQGYVFAAKQHAARLADLFGEADWASSLRNSAEDLRQRFEDTFWSEEMGSYALALDGAKRPCLVRTSNAGHALFAGIAAPDRAARTAATLMSQDGFSGWGLRTLARGEPRYNPMSYHNGSIWPHDNAMVALGMAQYGLKHDAATIFGAVFDAALHQESRRLPELYCGFLRKRRRGPVGYPVACSPQAWAAATPFAFLEACLGLKISAADRMVALRDPILPAFVDEVVVRGLQVADATLDLRIHRHNGDVSVNVLNKRGDVRLVVVK